MSSERDREGVDEGTTSGETGGDTDVGEEDSGGDTGAESTTGGASDWDPGQRSGGGGEVY